MNTHYLKFTWKVNIPDPLKNDTNYRIAIEWSIYNTNESSNQDWTYTITHSIKPIHCLIHDKLGETIKARDIRSNSEKLRAYLFRKYNNDPRLLDKYLNFDDFYDSFFWFMYKDLGNGSNHIDFFISNL